MFWTFALNPLGKVGFYLLFPAIGKNSKSSFFLSGPVSHAGMKSNSERRADYQQFSMVWELTSYCNCSSEKHEWERGITVKSEKGRENLKEISFLKWIVLFTTLKRNKHFIHLFKQTIIWSKNQTTRVNTGEGNDGLVVIRGKRKKCIKQKKKKKGRGF